MNLVTYSPGDPLPAENVNGIQQEIDSLRRVLSRLLADGATGGFIGAAANNAQVLQQGTPNATEVLVKGPAYWTIPTASQGLVPFYKSGDVTVTVPALNTTAGQSRNDLIIARVLLGAINAYNYEVVQGTPATTGTQTDPTPLPSNSIAIARITRAHGAGNIVTAMITDLRKRAAALESSGLFPDLVAPFGDPRVLSTMTFTANEARGVRVVIPRSGQLRDLAVFVDTASGNYDVGVFDTAATTRTALYRKGSTAVPTAGSWQIIGDPNIPVSVGDQLDFALALDNATAAVGRGNALTSGAAADLPAGFVTVVGGGANILAWSRATSFALPSTILESGIAGASTFPVIIARIA